MASMPASLGVVERPSSPDGKPHSVSERSLPSEKNIAQGGRFAFRSKNSKYLRYLPSRSLPSEKNIAQEGGETKKPSINLTMNGEDAKNPYARFSLEPSRKPGNEGLLHIKCCYNNKYWVPVAVPHSDDTGNKRRQTIIVCTANKPEDDESNPESTCTLFRPRWSSTENSISFLYKENPVCLENVDQVDCLIVRHGSKEEDASKFTVIDLETHEMVLPEEVCFRGDNGLYLCAVDVKGHLQFSSNDIGDPRAKHTIVTDENGTIRIKNNYLEKFWRFDDKPKSDNEQSMFSLKKETELNYGIYADAGPRGDTTTKFHLVKLDNNSTIALYVKDDDGSKRYCRRLTIDDKQHDLLCASAKGIIKEAMLKMHEAVLSRRIYNVEYHTLDARVYDHKTLTMSAAQAINRSSKENKAKLTLTYSSTKQATWESSVSTKAGVALTMKVEVPKITVGFEIQYQYELSESYNWGETNLDTNEQSIEYEIIVPPKTQVILRLVATQGVCEIPFSYMQEDILTNGGKVTSRLEDGLFRGINSYDFKYEVKESVITDGDPKKNNVNAQG